MDLFNDEIKCPKCGNLCKIPEGSVIPVYIFVSIISFLIGYFTQIGLWFGIVGSAVVFFYHVSVRDKSIRCPKCDYTWRK